MANIESKLTTIRSASGGEDVRDAIIGALRDINNDVPADMSNPEDYRGNMASGSDYSDSFNPPKLIRSIYIQQPNTGGKSMNLVSATITENGKYPTPDKDDGGGSYNPDEEVRYYKSVEVKVPQLANAVMDLEEEITQNGMYSAPADWGVDGLRSFTVNVNSAPVSGTFEVEFYDVTGTNIIKTELVPAYGSAYCGEYDGKTYQGQYFKGWSPSPTNVTKNLKCYPMFGSYVIDPSDIQDDWPVICSKRGAGYPLGSHRVLSLTGIQIPESQFEFLGTTVTVPAATCNFAQEIVKVAEGESGTTSTWISSAGFCVTSVPNGTPSIFPGINISHRANWDTSYFKHWLDTVLFNILPDDLKNTIKQVTKNTQVNNGGQYMDMQSLHKIWIPSNKELETWVTPIMQNPIGNYGPDTTRIETQGVDYTNIYIPDATLDRWGYATRTEDRIGIYGGNMTRFSKNSGSNPVYEANNTVPIYSANPHDSWQWGFCL